MTHPSTHTITFGDYELDVAAGELRRQGRDVRLQPQPLKLLALLVTRAGTVVSRDDIRRELWTEDTFVDFDQGVNFCIRQIRDVLRDEAERPIFIQTLPKKGYRFIAPVHESQGPQAGGDTKLMRALWTNIAELRMADERRRRNRNLIVAIAVILAVMAAGVFLMRR